ncbi:MAG: class I SAM-dependent methyltransferase [Pseudonocardia sp.]|nr:class I SAM-dependent methyltransferase [Actinomycetes bacterium]MDN5932195.1 class I SAM-dependent methyltransferase [Pseudonocardia sp.]
MLGPLEPVGPPADVLDAGCGTGSCARLLAADGHRVVGVDTAEEMLGVARDRAPGCGSSSGTPVRSTGSGPSERRMIVIHRTSAPRKGRSRASRGDLGREGGG